GISTWKNSFCSIYESLVETTSFHTFPYPSRTGTPRQGVTEAVKKIASLWPTKAISNKQPQMNGLVLPVENTPPQFSRITKSFISHGQLA
ncbi:unnamed protein product, partial [Brassica oleracea]